jgi:hypothetical protein
VFRALPARSRLGLDHRVAIGHQFGGCVDPIMAAFVEPGTTKGLDTTLCDGAVVVPPFELTD